MKRLHHSYEVALRVESIRGIYPHVQTLFSYVEELNKHLVNEGIQILLPNTTDAPLQELAKNVLVAATQNPGIPPNAIEGLKCSVIQAEEIIEKVIQNSMKDWNHQNVLALGYSSLRPCGSRSLFRNLDSRAPSTVVQILLSPHWKRLFSILGHVVVYHLLVNSTLLLPLPVEHQPGGKRRKLIDRCQRNTEFALLQLSGEIPNPICNFKRPLTNIIRYSKAILHRRARANYKPIENLNLDLERSETESAHHGSGGASKSSSGNSTRRHSRSFLQKRCQLNNGLPSMHFLQRLDGSYDSALELYTHIFFKMRQSEKNKSLLTIDSNGVSKPDSQSSTIVKLKLQKRIRPLIPQLQKFITRTKSRSFREVLGRVCPLPYWIRMEKRSSNDVDMSVMTDASSKPKLVARFLVLCVRQSVSTELMGSKKNIDILAKTIHKFIEKRTRNEVFNIENIVNNAGLKLTSIPWLHRLGPGGSKVCNPTDLAFRKRKFLQFIFWLFEGYLIPILLKSFHVTDSQVFGTRIIFYRREVWYRLLDVVMKETLHSRNRLFSPLSKTGLVNGIMERDESLRNLGIRLTPGKFITCFQLRFIPKTSGARPIQRLQAKQWGAMSKHNDVRSASTRITDPKILKKNLDVARNSIKSFLSLAHKILQVCCKKRKYLLGSSVFGLDEVYSKLLRFKEKWISGGRKPIFAVALDMTKSFDNIPLELLANQVMPDVVQQDRFVILRFAVVTRNESNGGLLRRFESLVCEKPGDEAAFRDLVATKLFRKYPCAIFIDLVRTQVVHRKELLESIRHFLLKNIVSLPRHTRRAVGTPYARQVRGVAQGNPLSPILTSLFYGFVERHTLQEYMNSCLDNQDGCHLHIRQIDDTFFASTDKNLTECFVKSLMKGSNDLHGMSVNCSKTRANYKSKTSGKERQIVIPWCGLLVNTKSMEVMNDFNRYCPPKLTSLREILTVEFESNTGRGLFAKAWTCFRPKLHPILLDRNVNSRKTVAVNIYQSAFLLALKMGSYALAVGITNGQFLARVVERAVTRCCELVFKASSSSAGRQENCVLSASTVEVSFLVQSSFLWVFRERVCQYQQGHVVGNTVVGRLEQLVKQSVDELSVSQSVSVQMLKLVSKDKANSVLWNIRL